MDSPLTRGEHNEYKATVQAEFLRLDAENERQNHRLNALEQSTERISELAISVEKLAQSVDGMVKLQSEQNERLKQLENRDGEMWRAVLKYAATAIVGILVGYAFTRLGIS